MENIKQNKIPGSGLSLALDSESPIFNESIKDSENIKESIRLKERTEVNKNINSISPLHVSGLIVTSQDVFAYQIEKPFLIFDAKSYVASLIDSWSEDRMEYALAGDSDAMRIVTRLIDAAEKWQDDPLVAPPYDIQLKLRLSQGPPRITASNLQDYLEGVIMTTNAVAIPPLKIMSDGSHLQEYVAEEYIPQFVIVVDHKPHPLFMATRKLRAALCNTGNDIDGVMVEESDLMERASPHIFAAHNLMANLSQPRVSPMLNTDTKILPEKELVINSKRKHSRCTPMQSEELFAC